MRVMGIHVAWHSQGREVVRSTILGANSLLFSQSTARLAEEVCRAESFQARYKFESDCEGKTNAFISGY